MFTRLLKYTYVKGKTDYMRGDDVKQLQTLLTDRGFSCGKIDGVFGKDTKNAVIKFQKANNLTADGIVGQKTAAALFQSWESTSTDELVICTFNIKRGYNSTTKQKKIGSLIASCSCSLAGLQEITPTAVKNIVTTANMYNYNCLTLTNYGTSILSNKSVKDAEIWVLPAGGEKRKLHRVVYNFNGTDIAFYNTHIQFVTSSNKTITDKQIKYVLDIMNSDSCKYKILTGDFNCEPSAYAPFTKAGYILTNTGQKFRCLEGGNRGVYTIDNIIYTNKFQIIDSWMSNTISQKLSDHDPLFAKFKLK